MLGSFQSATLGRRHRLWTPSDTTTAIWFDASDSSSITKSSNKVSQWNDKSGNTRHATQSTDGYRPTVSAEAVNGLDAIYFDGVDDKLVTSWTATQSTFSFYAVVNPTAKASGHLTILSKNSYYATDVNDFPFRIVMGAALIAVAVNLDGGGDYATDQTFQGSITGTGAFLTSISSKTSGTGAAVIKIHGSSAATANGQTLSSNSRAYTIGNHPYESGGGAGTGGFYNLICELIFIASYENGSQTEKMIEGYLSHKWGLQDKLPSNHLYRYRPPEVQL
jgi:hypothetical protein